MERLVRDLSKPNVASPLGLLHLKSLGVDLLQKCVTPVPQPNTLVDDFADIGSLVTKALNLFEASDFKAKDALILFQI